MTGIVRHGDATVDAPAAHSPRAAGTPGYGPTYPARTYPRTTLSNRATQITTTISVGGFSNYFTASGDPFRPAVYRTPGEPQDYCQVR